MRIVIIGTRGIPASYGGFETFADVISKQLANDAFDVTVVCQASDRGKLLLGKVNLFYSRFTKDNNPVRFYFNSLKIAFTKADIILVCGVGGAIFYPFFINRKAIIITHVDGREELRGKYSSLKKLYVRVSQKFAVKYSDHLVADSNAVKEIWKRNMHVRDSKISAIEFGAEINPEIDNSLMNEMNLKQGEYYLVVCRMVPENNLGMIIKGFINSGSGRKLVLVGDVTGRYAKKLLRYASHRIIFLNGIYDKVKLATLRKNCFTYIHGHSVGGTNPSLLESMAAGNICICHGNEFNKETIGGDMISFSSAAELSRKIKFVENFTDDEKEKIALMGKQRISSYYNWERITHEYTRLFNSFQRK